MKTIRLESIDVDELKCTKKQMDYIEGLMSRKEERYKEYLDKLAYDTRNRLSKKNASVLIDALINNREYRIL